MICPPSLEINVAGSVGSSRHALPVLPGWAGFAGSRTASAGLRRLLDNGFENSCGNCKSFSRHNHPILAMFGGCNSNALKEFKSAPGINHGLTATGEDYVR